MYQISQIPNPNDPYRYQPRNLVVTHKGVSTKLNHQQSSDLRLELTNAQSQKLQSAPFTIKVRNLGAFVLPVESV